LRQAHLSRGTVLHDTGGAVERVYFPEAGAISLVADLASGEIIETALIGIDGVVGGHDALRHTTALNRAVVQIEGSALAIEADALRQQTAACNVAHSLDARLARWLLRAQDLCGSKFMLTQEALAAFLGVRRTSVSLTAHAFQNEGVIRYRRGEIEIVDPDRLRVIACECHATLHAQRERLLPEPVMKRASGQALR
jgi:CRP-like cAMP-binding protein